MPGGFDAESLLRSLMDNIPGAIYRAANDAQLTVLTVSDEIEAMTGLPPSEFTDASTLISVTHAEDRERVNRAIDDARRRIERDLHDGAQQRLVVAALLLRTAENAIEPGSPAAKTLTAARAELDAGLAELRALARGIHPAVLTDRGLGPALQSLVAHCAVPVELHDELGERLAPAVETALYFVVSEALTNVDRYAEASRATVRLARNDGTVEVEVADDGRGGADPARGSGLRGLQDRLSAIDGTLALDSPPEHGTRLRANVPLPT